MVEYTIAIPSIFGPLEFAIQDDNISSGNRQISSSQPITNPSSPICASWNSHTPPDA